MKLRIVSIFALAMFLFAPLTVVRAAEYKGAAERTNRKYEEAYRLIDAAIDKVEAYNQAKNDISSKIPPEAIMLLDNPKEYFKGIFEATKTPYSKEGLQEIANSFMIVGGKPIRVAPIYIIMTSDRWRDNYMLWRNGGKDAEEAVRRVAAALWHETNHLSLDGQIYCEEIAVDIEIECYSDLSASDPHKERNDYLQFLEERKAAAVKAQEKVLEALRKS